MVFIVVGHHVSAVLLNSGWSPLPGTSLSGGPHSAPNHLAFLWGSQVVAGSFPVL